MALNLIADTNVFYDIGLKRLDINRAVGAGERLHYSPVSVLEIAGKLSDAEHTKRKAAAQAILTSRAIQLPDPESFLTVLWGLDLAEPPADWSHVVTAVAQSKNMAELQSGVADVWAGVRRTVRPSVAGDWRKTTEGKWVDDMLDIMRSEIPGFSAWHALPPARRKPQVPTLRGKAKANFLVNPIARDWMASYVFAMQQRAFIKAARAKPFAPDSETVKTLLKASNAAMCFAAIYTQYIIRLLTKRALPKQNDSGDIELFCYSVSDDWVMLTSDTLWEQLAQLAGYPQRVRLIKP